MLGVLSVTYLFAYAYATDSFFDRLKERAFIVSSNHLETDQRHESEFDSLSSKYNQILTGETIYIYDKNSSLIFHQKNDTARYSEFASKVKSRTEFRYRKNDRLTLGFLYNDEKGSFYVLASAIDTVGTGKLNNMLQTMFVSFFIFLILIVLAGQFLAKKALNPIQIIIQQVKDISATNLHRRLDSGTETDEISQLALTFNSMLARLEDSFVSQSQFVHNASHELRNPLAAMMGEAEITLNKARSGEFYQQSIRNFLDSTQRLNHIVNSLLQLSQTSPETIASNMSIINLNELLIDSIETVSAYTTGQRILVTLPEDEGIDFRIRGNLELLQIALTNIIDNACKYSGDKNVLCQLDVFGNLFLLSIEDQGIGMTKIEVDRIFEPFFRSEKVRDKKGFGIGMAVSHKILVLHEILVEVESEPEKGTKFILTFQGIEGIA